MSERKAFLDALVRHRFRSARDIRNLLDEEKNRHRSRVRRHVTAGRRYIKGVHNGQFFRIEVPPQRPLLPRIPKIQTILKPKAFGKSEPANATTSTSTTSNVKSAHERAAAQAAADAKRERVRDFATQLQDWWAENWAVLVLNLGSICSLIGFTRSDILELRTLSVTGSMASLVYLFSLKPIRYTPIVWSLIFTTVNGWKIYQVLTEREGTVHMTQQEESVYSNFFMAHGVTPKQFERIWRKAEIVHVKQGEAVVVEGQALQHVCLVTQGETRAQTGVGRRLTAASFKVDHNNKLTLAADDNNNRLSWTSGAWIGEIAFLEQYWKKQHKTEPSAPSSPPVPEAASEIPLEQGAEPTRKLNDGGNDDKRDSEEKGSDEKRAAAAAEPPNDSRRRVMAAALKRSTAMSSRNALYTIVAVQDSVLMRWTHADMEELLAQSHDLRGAMTRAMTAAIVGKVINFTVSRREISERQDVNNNASSSNNWTAWLRDWKSNNTAEATTEVQVQNLEPAAANSEDPLREESPSDGPVKRFG